MSEAKAVEILREELEKAPNFTEKVNHLSIKVKWGQNDTIGIGNIRTFLEKYTEVFTFDGTTVKLNKAPAPPGLKGPDGKGKAPSKAGSVPMNSKAGPPPAPSKRNYFDLDEDEGDSPDSKAPRQDNGPIGSKASAMSTVKGGKDIGKGDKGDFGAPSKGGAPNSKAAAYDGKGKPDGKGDGKGGCYGGKDAGFDGKGGKGGFDGKGKDAPFDGKGKDGGFDGKGKDAAFDGKGKDGGFDGKGKDAFFDGKGKDAGFDGKGKDAGFDGKGGKDAGFDGKGKGFGYDGKGKDGGFDGGEQGGKDGFKGDKGGKGGEATGNPAAPLSPAEAKQAIQEDRLLPQQASAAIESFKSNGVEIELSLLSKKLAPSEEAQQNVQRCLALVRTAVSSIRPPNGNLASLELCGSFAQGTGIQASAMDLSFRLPVGTSFEDSKNFVSELRNRLSQQSNVVEVTDGLTAYPHAQSPLAIDLKGATPALVANIMLEEKRENRPPTLDEVIKQLCSCCEAASELVRLVKMWSVNHGLANHQEGFLNGAAWAVIVVFFLQKSKLVPPYSYLSQGNHVAPAPAGMPLSQLLQNFFDFLQSRSAAPPGMSVWQGEEFQGPPSPFVEDPAYFLEHRQSRSLSESLGEAQWARIVDESKKALNRIKVRPGRWFHWAEVFDPTDRKPAKIHGLAQHLAGELNADFGKGACKGFAASTGKGMDGKGAPPSDGKGMDAKGAKGMDGKGAPPSDGKGMDGKGAAYSDGKGGKDDFKGGKPGKDSDGKGWGKEPAGKGWADDGKGSSDGKGGKDDFKGGKDDFKGGKAGKDDSKGYGKDDGKGYGKDDGKGFADSKGYGKDDGKGSWGKDGDSKGFGKSKSYGKDGKGKPY